MNRWRAVPFLANRRTAMFRARQGKEIVVRAGNRIGLLGEMAKVIAEKGISVLAVDGRVSGDGATIRFVTDDNLRAGEALAAHDLVPVEEDVILVDLPHKPGMLRGLADVLAAERIDILRLYATAAMPDDRCLVVLHTTNDAHALPKLEKVAASHARAD
jgi:hypothetical protein